MADRAAADVLVATHRSVLRLIVPLHSFIVFCYFDRTGNKVLFVYEGHFCRYNAW